MVVCVRIPGADARQASLPVLQSLQFIISLSVLTILAGVIVGGLELRREIRRRVQAEEALRKAEMDQAIITERNRLASDLHDSVTQGLYGIVLHAGAASGQLSAGQPDRATAFLEEIKEAGKEALAEMRLLIFELRPPVLEEEGLAGALEARLYAVERRAGLKTEIKSDLQDRLPADIEEGIYRIGQEALNNALKHAHADHIRVHLCQDGRGVTLVVADDGNGFDLATSRTGGGMGLSGMDERAEKMNGHLKIESRPGEGTSVIVEVKL